LSTVLGFGDRPIDRTSYIDIWGTTLKTELTLSTIWGWCDRQIYRNALCERHILIYEVQTLKVELILSTIWGIGDRPISQTSYIDIWGTTLKTELILSTIWGFVDRTISRNAILSQIADHVRESMVGCPLPPLLQNRACDFHRTRLLSDVILVMDTVRAHHYLIATAW